MSTPPPISRAELITLCVRGVVPVEHWSNRDSASAQRQLGEVRALLEAGADWQVSSSSYTVSNSQTWWIEVTFPGFNAFEEGRHDEEHWDSDTFYIPTAARLDHVNGEDWY